MLTAAQPIYDLQKRITANIPAQNCDDRDSRLRYELARDFRFYVDGLREHSRCEILRNARELRRRWREAQQVQELFMGEHFRIMHTAAMRIAMSKRLGH